MDLVHCISTVNSDNKEIKVNPGMWLISTPHHVHKSVGVTDAIPVEEDQLCSARELSRGAI